MASSTEYLMACEDCDLLIRQAKAPMGHSIICPRCGKCIDTSLNNSLVNTLCLSLTGLVFFLPAMLLPLLTFTAVGLSNHSNVIESIVSFVQSGYHFVAFALLFVAVIFPLLLLCSAALISGCLMMKKHPPWLAGIFRFYIHVEEWAMVEVYLLGMIITVIKMLGTAEVHYDFGFFCFVFLVLATVGVNTVIDRRLFWRLIGDKGKKPEYSLFTDTILSQENTVCTDDDGVFVGGFETAASRGLILCHDCQKLIPQADGLADCPRCGAHLHLRKQQSLSRTWALVLCSMLLLLPANLFPIMEVEFLGMPDLSTILDGIVYFFKEGSFLIGAVILTASVLVPIFKVVGLIILLLTIQFKSNINLRQKAILFRVITFIGRWSMLDVFVIGLLSTLVNFGFFTSIGGAPAVTYFCVLVVVTMVAVISFDPRLMWDVCQPCATKQRTLPLIKNEN